LRADVRRSSAAVGQEVRMDLAYLALAAAFFALSVGFIKLCERI
jgi:hypothetical protein